MNWLDIVLVIIFIVTAIGGAKSGLIKSVFNLAALVFGVVLAVRFYVGFGSWMEHFISNQTAARVVAFVIILAATIVAGAILGSIFSAMASMAGLGLLDRVGGAVFGVAVAAIVFGGILAFLSSAGWLNGTIAGSFLGSFLVDHFLPWLGSLSPFFRNPTGWMSSPA